MVVEAVEHELQDLDKRKPGVLASARAALALELARQLDNDHNSATSKSMCAKQLNETLDLLWAQVPPEQMRDRIDEIGARRAERRRRAAS